jgi:hypothetical protein
MKVEELVAALEKDIKLGENCALELKKHNWTSDDEAWDDLGPSGVAQWFASKHAIRKGNLARALLKVLEKQTLPPPLLKEIGDLLSE